MHLAHVPSRSIRHNRLCRPRNLASLAWTPNKINCIWLVRAILSRWSLWKCKIYSSQMVCSKKKKRKRTAVLIPFVLCLRRFGCILFFCFGFISRYVRKTPYTQHLRVDVRNRIAFQWPGHHVLCGVSHRNYWKKKKQAKRKQNGQVRAPTFSLVPGLWHSTPSVMRASVSKWMEILTHRTSPETLHHQNTAQSQSPESERRKGK